MLVLVFHVGVTSSDTCFLHMCKFVHRNRILVDWEAGSGHGGFKFAPYVTIIRLVAVMRFFIQLSQLHDYKLKWSL